MFHVKQFQELTGVTPETLGRLQIYADLLEKWQRKINLVGPATIPDLWQRHMMDSAQLHPLLPRPDCSVMDFGSGAGFPGLVLAIMGGPQVTLVESDGRKCAFLAEVMRATGVGSAARLENCRIEDLQQAPADVVTSRALASLDKLLGFAEPFLGESSICLFLKGKMADQELTDAGKNWMMQVSKIQSLTDTSGAILKLENIARHDG
ncbi:MAG: 16S rRNA (guanine(527)-N(7))-methyltransferase RsmG [Rhodospirillales bacterium]|nr:16S rRNA (guanine(527)-N(7))-methyltransferase RsmG [Rhodospirillales bacterium]